MLDHPIVESGLAEHLVENSHAENLETAATKLGQTVPQNSGILLEGTERNIGPYRLLEKIGEGGFGEVFVAEQTEPVQRKVAVKIIKPGMDSREVVARFAAERQALAMMDHPNIARVF
jgi:serine/threonine protein kinase